MKYIIGAALTALCVVGACSLVHADAKDAATIVNKGIVAVGGADKLAKITTLSWKTKGTISFNGSDNPVSDSTTVQGLDHIRQDVDGEFGGNPFKGVTVFSGDKGWRDFAGNHTDMDKAALADEKRTVYLALLPITLVSLKSKDFTLDTVPDKTVADKPAAGIKVVAPDGKDFTLYFDKDSGLPVELTAKVVGFDGMEFTQDTFYSDYKDMAGIKKATKVVSKRDGEKFIESQVTDFQVLDTVPAKTFTDM